MRGSGTVAAPSCGDRYLLRFCWFVGLLPTTCCEGKPEADQPSFGCIPNHSQQQPSLKTKPIKTAEAAAKKAEDEAKPQEDAKTPSNKAEDETKVDDKKAEDDAKDAAKKTEDDAKTDDKKVEDESKD